MSLHLSRRKFLKSTLAAGTVACLPRILRADDKKPPSEMVRVGVVGVAGQGVFSWKSLKALPDVDIVALCDVDERRIGPAKEAFSKATFDVDFRKMLDRKNIDAVVVATPDHTHAVATMAALKSGRDVYCEKPLTHDVYETRVVAETAKKLKRITQMGTQIHAGDNYRRVVELVQSGAIGTVQEVHTWCGRSYGGAKRPKESEPIPAGLHWDLWLGTAPERPYHHGPNKNGYGTYEPFNWRMWWDFGGGTMSDMACHHMDLPFWALGLRYPTKVSSHGSPSPDAEAVADWQIVTYEFPARGKQPPVKLTWYDGGKRPELFAKGKLPKWGDGNLFVGSKGMLIAGYSEHKLLPEVEFKDFKRPEPFIAKSPGHHAEWIAAIKSRKPSLCDFDYSGALTEAVLLGNVSYRCGQALEWDAENLKIKNAPEAEKFLRREYRKGWSL
jgi:predicted dehydrogenase